MIKLGVDDELEEQEAEDEDAAAEEEEEVDELTGSDIQDALGELILAAITVSLLELELLPVVVFVVCRSCLVQYLLLNGEIALIFEVAVFEVAILSPRIRKRD